VLKVHLWRPVSRGLQGLLESLLPVFPDITRIRELSMSPFLRQDLDCQSVGVVQLDLYVASTGFDKFGVRFPPSG
jgi:hypothetical protein